MELRKKRYRAECRRCKAIRKMEVVGSSDDKKHVWLRCASCHMVYLFPTSLFGKGNLVQSPLSPELSVGNNSPTNEVIEYALHKTYALGQRIYHKRFNDIGKVIAKSKLNHGSKIVVSFKRCGEKTLVEGISLQ